MAFRLLFRGLLYGGNLFKGLLFQGSATPILPGLTQPAVWLSDPGVGSWTSTPGEDAWLSDPGVRSGR